MTPSDCILVCGLLAFQESTPTDTHAQLSSEVPRPHIVLILADDLGWGDVGYHGATDLRTPHIDALAESGLQLDQFYAMPTCTPTRAALLTGRYPSRYGLQSCALMPWSQAGLALTERLLPELLRDVGYRTAIVGKWHLGHFQAEYLPTRRGFNSHYGSYSDGVDYFKHDRNGSLDWHRDEQPVRETGYATDLLAAEASRIIERHEGDEPLFLYVPFTAPHAPIQAPLESEQEFKHIEDPARRTYAASVAHLDTAVGRIVRSLETRGIREQTLLLFLSDNGAAGNHAGSNTPLRGSKFSAFEGGIRVPAIASWPTFLDPNQIIEVPFHVIDLVPTFAALAGASTDTTKPLDGIDIWSVLSDGLAPSPRTLVLHLDNHGGAIRVGDWKLVVRDKQRARGPTLDGLVKLFNLAKDPIEKRNLAKSNPEKVASMFAELRATAKQAAPKLQIPFNAPDSYIAPKVLGPKR
ncbi:MAG: arylsulfatase A-like enzyme [Planctomycetota bacterium]|jgi:arylsulfatase A-like enzyme